MKTDLPELLTPKETGELEAATPKSPSRSIGWSENSSDWDVPGHNLATAPATAQVILQAEDLNVLYGPNQILTNVAITLYEGDTLGLLGLNGAGKSTLLKVLAGALAPRNGTVQIGENELYQNPLTARMDIG